MYLSCWWYCKYVINKWQIMSNILYLECENLCIHWFNVYKMGRRFFFIIWSSLVNKNIHFFKFLDFQIWTVHLNVTDVNDEKPRFVNQPRPFLATVPVNPRVGQLVYELLATDPDTNSDIHYNLESGNDIKMIDIIFLNINNVYQTCLEASLQKQFCFERKPVWFHQFCF